MGAGDVVFGAVVTVGQSWDRLSRASFAQATGDDEGGIVLAYSRKGLEDGQTLGDN
jgi:hypothetical protein